MIVFHFVFVYEKLQIKWKLNFWFEFVNEEIVINEMAFTHTHTLLSINFLKSMFGIVCQLHSIKGGGTEISTK